MFNTLGHVVEQLVVGAGRLELGRVDAGLVCPNHRRLSDLLRSVSIALIQFDDSSVRKVDCLAYERNLLLLHWPVPIVVVRLCSDDLVRLCSDDLLVILDRRNGLASAALLETGEWQCEPVATDTSDVGVVVRQFDWETVYDADGYIALLETFSGHRTMQPWQRRRLYGEIRRRLAERPDGTIRRHRGARPSCRHPIVLTNTQLPWHAALAFDRNPGVPGDAGMLRELGLSWIAPGS